MELDAVLRQGIVTLFSPLAVNDMEMREVRASENPIVLDEEEDSENSPPTTPVSVLPIEPHRLPGSLLFGRRIENVLEFVYRILIG